MTASTLHAAAAPLERPIASHAVTSLAAAFLHRSVAGAPAMPPPSPRQLLCSPLSPRRSFTREPRVRQITNAPFCVASGFAVRSSPGEATCSSGDAGGERAVSRACGTAFCAALALAAAAMMTRHDSVGGRERGSGSDRSGGVRRSRYERGARLRLCLAPVPCVSSHDAREGTALSGSPSPGRMPSTCGPNPEVPWRRRQHQCARPTQLVWPTRDVLAHFSRFSGVLATS